MALPEEQHARRDANDTIAQLKLALTIPGCAALVRILTARVEADTSTWKSAAQADAALVEAEAARLSAQHAVVEAYERRSVGSDDPKTILQLRDDVYVAEQQVVFLAKVVASATSHARNPLSAISKNHRDHGRDESARKTEAFVTTALTGRAYSMQSALDKGLVEGEIVWHRYHEHLATKKYQALANETQYANSWPIEDLQRCFDERRKWFAAQYRALEATGESKGAAETQVYASNPANVATVGDYRQTP